MRRFSVAQPDFCGMGAQGTLLTGKWEEPSMAEKGHAVIHFMDGTKITLKLPRQAGDDPVTILKNVKRALEADRILAEVEGE